MTRNTGTQGKIDRADLPMPAAANTSQDEVLAGPRWALEERLAAIVAGLLGVDRVGRDDNVFLLGGTSLLGLQVVARVADTFDVDLPLHLLFTAPTVAQLSIEIERLILVKVEAMSEDEIQRLLG